MEPSATPPWRVLDAPSPAATAGAGAGAASPNAPQAAGPHGLTPAALKALGICAAAIAVAIVAFILASGGGEASTRIVGGASLPIANGATASDGTAAVGAARVEELVVEIVGAVTRPGVYRLRSGSRVGDLVAAAGGYGPRVDTARAAGAMNLAAVLRDGDQVRVPSRDDAAVNPASTAGAATATGGQGSPLDLNDATQAELETLPGIGPATALKIIAAREEAPFAAVEELRSRGVLGEKTYQKVRELVAVR